MRELDGHHASGAKEDLQAADEVVEIGDLSEHVVAQDQVGSVAERYELTRGFPAEELYEGRNSPLFGGFCNVRCWLDAERGDAALHEELEEIAVIARDFNDLAARR